jgi:tetratricopeptide (TPR) repeat protein
MISQSAPLLVFSFYSVVFWSACGSEELAKQAELIRQQKSEIARQEKIKEELTAEKKKQENCQRAFRDYFDKAQLSTNREGTISLYRQGLKICPEDDVAHYELGRALADAGRTAEAADAFEAALKINPDFADAKRQLEAIRRNR